MSVIYKITCIENQKFYIGSTVNKTQRWARHRKDLRTGCHPNKNMQASWDKYGETAFLFEVLEEVENPAELLLVEQKYLDDHAGKDYCFNWALAAGAPMRGKSGAETPNFGKSPSIETRAKLSAAVSGRSNPNWGKQPSAETRAKISEANKNNPWKGQKHTPEAIAKIAAASKARIQTEEEKAKRRESMKGHEVSSTTRMKISATLTGEGNYWYGKNRPDHGAKVSKAVIVRDADGDTQVYTSISLLREMTGMKAPTINRALKAGTPIIRGPFVGFLIKYVDTSNT